MSFRNSDALKTGMAEDDINYAKEVLGSQWNLAFIGVMIFLMLVFNFWGFLALLTAGQLGALFLAQTPLIQRLIRVGRYKDQKEESAEAEQLIVQALPESYQPQYESVRRLCEEIERRSGELGTSSTNALLSAVVEKLSAFRFEYARMLRAHHLLSTRNYRNIQSGLASEIAHVEQAVEAEQAVSVRTALNQNLNILRQRLTRIRKLQELVRLLEARLQIVRNSLSLIQDEVYTFTDVAGISGLVDNLLTNLSVSDEFRADYEDVLSAETDLTALSALEEGSSNITAQRSTATPIESASSRAARAARKQSQRFE